MNLLSTFFAHVLSKSPLISVQCQLQKLALQLSIIVELAGGPGRRRSSPQEEPNTSILFSKSMKPMLLGER